MWWAVMITAMACSACAAAAPAHDSLPPLPSLQVLQIDRNAPDEATKSSVSVTLSPSTRDGEKLCLVAGDKVTLVTDRARPAGPIWEYVMENMNLIPSLSGSVRYESAGAPWLYYIDDTPRDSQELRLGLPRAPDTLERARAKRKMPSLSINNPMEVLRQRLMLEVARKQLREASQRQAVANRVFLQNVGKRGFHASRSAFHYDE